ncbi:MAG TPA: hypothetical protein VIL74_17490 [Pyrinomonadaceae bacterium]|jgi:hypothetical protein
MELSALFVVLTGTLLFFGFALWMAIYSRRNGRRKEQGETE